MTTSGESSPPTPLPVEVIGYASGETIGGASRGVRMLLGFFAVLHLLLGGPLVLGPVLGVIIDLVAGAPDPDGFVALAFGLALGSPNVACGVWMLVRRRWTWRAAQITLTVLCILELLAFITGAVLCVVFKHTTGWDQISLVAGIIFVIASTLLLWLHAGAKWWLLHADVRRAFGITEFDSILLHRRTTIVLVSIYALTLAIGAPWYLAR